MLKEWVSYIYLLTLYDGPRTFRSLQISVYTNCENKAEKTSPKTMHFARKVKLDTLVFFLWSTAHV